MKRGGRIPGTFTAPHAGGPPPRCQRCDELADQIRRRPEEIPIDRLGKMIAWLEKASPPPGTMVRADADGVEIWACPYHASLERTIVGRRRSRARIIDTVRWKVVPRT